MSLHQYFLYKKNSSSSGPLGHHNCIIPNSVGGRNVAIYPPLQGYAKSILILHVPWNNTFNEKGVSRNYIKEFKAYLESSRCPMSVIIVYKWAKERYLQKNSL